MLWPRWYSPPRTERKFLAGRLINYAAQLAGCLPAHVTGTSRKPTYVGARSAVAVVLREHGWSYYQIGAALGGRDHQTIRHACNTFHNRTSRYENWLGFLADLRDVECAA